jgi:hypothetical protein
MVYPWEIDEKDDCPNPVRTIWFSAAGERSRWCLLLLRDRVNIYPPLQPSVLSSDEELVFDSTREPACIVRRVDGRWVLDYPGEVSD